MRLGSQCVGSTELKATGGKEDASTLVGYVIPRKPASENQESPDF
ncbi:hypothetical protein [Nostoc sp.]